MSSTFAISEQPNAHRNDGAVNEPSITVARANGYHILARAFALPNDMEAEQRQLLRSVFGRAEEPLRGLGTETAHAWEVALADRETLGIAYARLFLGPFEVLAAPYASIYLDPNQQLMGDISQHVAETYREVEIGFPRGPHEPPDHIALELEFMYYLAYQEAMIADSIWYERQERFWNHHLGRWLPKFAEQMVRANCHPFYDALGYLVCAFASSEEAYFSGLSSEV